jgi:hypothetical protein
MIYKILNIIIMSEINNKQIGFSFMDPFINNLSTKQDYNNKHYRDSFGPYISKTPFEFGALPSFRSSISNTPFEFCALPSFGPYISKTPFEFGSLLSFGPSILKTPFGTPTSAFGTHSLKKEFGKRDHDSAFGGSSRKQEDKKEYTI